MLEYAELFLYAKYELMNHDLANLPCIIIKTLHKALRTNIFDVSLHCESITSA